MTYNPFDTARNIELGYNSDTGYFLHLRNGIDSSLHFTTGSAVATGMIMLANGVQHFDYHSSLFNDADATEAFIREAATVGFVA